jgi:hypothetical protein
VFPQRLLCIIYQFIQEWGQLREEKSAFTGEGTAFCLIASFCTASGDINSGGGTFAVFVVGTFLGFAVDVDLFAAAVVRFTVHGSTGSISFTETSAVCFIRITGTRTGDLDITSGTEFVFVVHTFGCRTFENCHSSFLLD